MKSEKTLLSEFPELAEEFHPTKNGVLTPSNIAPQSGKKVWWIGKCGHEWQATVSNRTGRKSGCPYCAGKKPIVGETDLATVFPNLCAEWDYSKNGTLSPQDINPYSGKKAWWICSKGHSWRVAISSRTFSNSGCPYCAGKLPIIGETDLASLFPNLLPEWNYEKNLELFDITPALVTAHSQKKVWWKCSRGHEWLSTIDHRVNGHGCPICSRHLQKSYPETAIFFYLSSVFPDSVQSFKSDFLGKLELDIYIPSIRTAIEYDGSAYHNKSFSANREKKKYSITAKHGITLIRIREAGLPECASDKQVSSHLGQLYFNSPAYNAELVSVINKVFSLLGQDTNIDLATLEANRTDIQSLLYSEAKETNPIPQILLDEWDYIKNGDLRPKMFSKGSNQVVYWRCKKGHSWSAPIKERVGAKNHKATGCPYCVGNAAQEGYNDFASQYPELLSEWDYKKNSELLKITPDSITAHSDKKVWWICEKGHSWQTHVRSRTAGRGCPYCTNQKVLEGFNDLATTNPDLIKQWDYQRNNALGIYPNKVVQGSHLRAYWVCPLGHTWMTSIRDRADKNNGIKTGCPICANKVVLKGFNDFESQHPELLNSWDFERNYDIAPSAVVSGSNKKVWWKCPYCNHRWQMSVLRRSAGHGCPKCKK